jgi:hypothetical protein
MHLRVYMETKHKKFITSAQLNFVENSTIIFWTCTISSSLLYILWFFSIRVCNISHRTENGPRTSRILVSQNTTVHFVSIQATLLMIVTWFISRIPCTKQYGITSYKTTILIIKDTKITNLNYQQTVSAIITNTTFQELHNRCPHTYKHRTPLLHLASHCKLIIFCACTGWVWPSPPAL